MQGIFDLFDFSKKVHDGEIYFPRKLENKYTVSNEILGTGSFSVVRECTEKKTNKNYALKIISKKSIKGREKILSSELDILKKVNHPHTIRLHDLYETGDNVYIITDLALGGELFNQLILKGSYTEQDAANLAKQLLEGVAYLHDLGIVHRDLKPENLLFKDKSENADLVITDFGLSQVLKNDKDLLFTLCGTPAYVAPEVLLKKGYSKPADIWSIGVIIYTMLCGYTPFWGEGQNELLESIIEGDYDYEDEHWSGISDLAKDLIDKMLTYEPSKRITAKEALKHPWFESANKTDILEKVRCNLSAGDRLRKAIHLIRDVNIMRKTNKSIVHNDDKSVNEKAITVDLQKQVHEDIEEKKRRRKLCC